jgi:hypothetical protein
MNEWYYKYQVQILKEKTPKKKLSERNAKQFKTGLAALNL